MNIDFKTAIEERRSIYHISNESPISNEKIEDIIKHAVKHTPTAFNSQSGRVVVLLGDNHTQLWDITKEVLRKIVPPENFPSTEEKLNSFRQGYGTVLFFEDESVIKGLQEQFPSYKDNFPIWSHHASGILQFNIWTLLAVEGIGASLQHYNPLIDEDVKNQWHIPSNWKLIAQMPFGKVITSAGDKDFIPLENRVKIFK